MTTFYPQEPTKWTTALEEIYAKQSDRLKRHKEQLRQRDQQMVKKAENESLAKTFGALAQFSSTVGAAVQAGKKRHETWKEKYKLGLSTSKEWLHNQETIDKIRKLRYKEEKEKVSHQPEIDKLVSILRKDGENSAAFDLLNVSGRRLAAQNELLAQNAAAGHTVASMRDFYEDNGLHDKVKEVDTNSSNPDYMKGMLFEYQRDRLAHLNLNDDAIAGILGGELKRQRDTAGGTVKAKANAAVSDKDDIRILTQIETANSVGTFEESVWSVRKSLIKEGKFQEYTDADGKVVTVNQQVDKYLFETLNDLSHDGLINTSQLQPYIDSGFKHPAGKNGESTPGEILFTKEQVNRLIKSTQFGEGRYVSIRTQLDTEKLAEIQARRSQGIETEEDSEALDRIDQRGLVSDKSVQDVRDIDVADNTPESYQIAKEENISYYTGSKQSHRLKDKENFKYIQNDGVRNELGKLVEKDEQYYRSVELPTTHKGFVDAAEEDLKISPSQKGKLDKGVVSTSGTFKDLSSKVALKRQELHTELRKDYPDNPVRAKEEAEKAFETWKVENGYYETDRNNNPKAGILSADISGRYRIFEDTRAAKLERSGISTKRNKDLWFNRKKKALNESGGNIKKALDTANSFTDPPDLLSVFQGKPDEKGVIKPYYSVELIVKARALRIQPSELVRRQIIALQNNGEQSDKDFVKKHGLDKYLKVLEDDPAIKMEQALENLAKDNLLFIWKNGIETMTGKQITRFIDELSGIKLDDPK